jgi:CBS domain-containing protein
MGTRKGTGTRGVPVAQPLSERVALLFGEVRRTQLARATADAFVRQALAYMKEHRVTATVAVNALLTPSVVREAARGLTGPLSDAALLDFARKGVLRAIEEVEEKGGGLGS